MSAISTMRAAILAVVLCGSLLTWAQIAVPPLVGHITDQTATLSAEQTAALEQTLQALEARKGSQVAVLIVPTTAPEAIEQYALRVAEQWKLGRKKVDDGAILVVAKDDRTLRIEVGYGLEGALNDATSKRIISEIIVPRFQQGDFNGGIRAGVDQIASVIDGEPLPSPKDSRDSSRGFSGISQLVPVMLMLALGLGGILRAMLGRFPGALATAGIVAGGAWLFAGTLWVALIAGAIALLFTLLSGGMGALGLGGHLGGLGRGGFGGGGFSGGGGGFGGGGASGRW